MADYPTLPGPSRLPDSEHARTRFTELEITVAFAVVFVMAFRLRVRPDIPIGYFIGVVLLPVTVMALRRYRGMLPIAVVTVVAAISGILLTVGASPVRSTSHSLAEIHTARVLGIALATMALLWARSIIGSRNTVFMYGLGMLASVGLEGVNHANSWKFSFSVPLVLLVMSLPKVYRHRAIESVLLLALSAYSALHDSRSAAATLLIAAALVMVQARPRRVRPVTRARATRILLGIAAVALVAFFVLQFAIVRGVLGAEVQQRTLAQIHTSGSVILGGRAEAGASVKLLKEQVWGYGAGTLPSHHDVQVGKEGLIRVGADPENPATIDYLSAAGSRCTPSSVTSGSCSGSPGWSSPSRWRCTSSTASLG